MAARDKKTKTEPAGSERHWFQRFLRRYAEYPVVTRVCNELKIERRSVYLYMERHPKARAAFKKTRRLSIAAVEDAAFAGALDGNANLIMFVLRNNSSRYRKAEIPHKDKSIVSDASQYSPQEAEAMRAALVEFRRKAKASESE